MKDPAIRIRLRSGKTFTFLWGDSIRESEVASFDHEDSIRTAREHIREGRLISGWFGFDEVETEWTEICPQGIEAVQSILLDP